MQPTLWGSLNVANRSVDSYVPSGPYIFKSGRYAGKAADLMMFSAPGFCRLRYMLEKMEGGLGPNSRPNQAHQHLRWLMQAGEHIRPTLLCKFCRQKTVTTFTTVGDARFGYSISTFYTCCPNCLAHLRGSSMGNASFTSYRIAFSSILRFSVRADQEAVIRLIRDVCNLPKRLNKQIAFEFFQNCAGNIR